MAEATTENVTDQHHDEIDEDDDQVNAAHKIVPSRSQSMTSVRDKQDTQPSNDASKPANVSNYELQNLIRNDVKKYINTTIPKDHSGFVHCHIKREKVGLTKTILQTFVLYADGENENDKTFLLTARKILTIGGHSEYFIGTNADTVKDLNDENSMAKLRATNLTSTEYILYDHQHTPPSQTNKQQSAAIIYDDHIFGSGKPRKLIVLIADTEKNIRLLKDNETLIDEFRGGRTTDLIEMRNTPPAYDEEAKQYHINLMEGRIKVSSHKNFQLVTVAKDQPDNVVMEFGRMDVNNFALDYRYPLTGVQAFAIALSSFHNRFRT